MIDNKTIIPIIRGDEVYDGLIVEDNECFGGAVDFLCDTRAETECIAKRDPLAVVYRDFPALGIISAQCNKKAG